MIFIVNILLFAYSCYLQVNIGFLKWINPKWWILVSTLFINRVYDNVVFTKLWFRYDCRVSARIFQQNVLASNILIHEVFVSTSGDSYSNNLTIISVQRYFGLEPNWQVDLNAYTYTYHFESKIVSKVNRPICRRA